MKKYAILGSSTALAIIIALALFLRPSRSINSGPEMATPERIAPAARAVIRSRMLRHRTQLGELVLRVIVLDYDGTARTAGEIFDEPALARPVAGDELNALLPDRFFQLQADLRSGARLLIAAAARKDGRRLAEEFSSFTKTCIACHDLYLHSDSTEPAATP